MWLWPIHKFWRYAPWDWLLGLIWNASEVLHVALPGPLAPFIFGRMIGRPGKRSNCGP